MKRILQNVGRFSSDVFYIDAMYSGIPNFACCFFMVEGQKVTIVETGTNWSVPTLVKAIEETGFTTNDVEYIIPTHVHLDHSGGCSLLVEKCPKATVLAHPKTAKFLHEHEGIVKGAIGVYGEEKVKELYGEITSVPKERIQVIEDGESVQLSQDRTLNFFYALGHATHHMVCHDLKSNGIFTGDAFGMNYPQYGNEYFLPSTTPIDFNPHQLKESIDHIFESGADKAYLTHFGIWEDMKEATKLNHITLDLMYEKMVLKVPSLMDKYENDERLIRDDLEEEMTQVLEEILPKMSREEILNEIPLSNDIVLNAWGSLVYVQRQMKKGLEI